MTGMNPCPKCGSAYRITESGLSLTFECPNCGNCWATTNMRALNEHFKMANDNEHNPDPNQNAAKIVAKSTATQEPAAGDVEAAWLAWSGHIQNVDERGMTLLRAAFEAGYDAGQSSPR